jgi:hypothetical protein
MTFSITAFSIIVWGLEVTFYMQGNLMNESSILNHTIKTLLIQIYDKNQSTKGVFYWGFISQKSQRSLLDHHKPHSDATHASQTSQTNKFACLQVFISVLNQTWAEQDSNLRPLLCKRSALTN